MSTRGLPVEADDLLITTGSQQALGLVAMALLNPGDVVLVEDPTYLAALQAFQLADLRAGRDPERRARAGPRRADRGRARQRRQGRLPDPDLPEPDRPHDAGRAPRGARRGGGGREPVARRGRPVQRAAARRRAGRPARRAARRARPHDRHPDAVQGALARPADRLPARAARAARPARRGQAGGRPAHVDGRPARRRALARERTTSASTSPASPPTTARAATRCSPGSPSTCRPARAARAPRAACSSGSSCPTATTPRRSSPARSSAASRSCPGTYFYAGEPRRETLRVSFATATPDELREGAARLGAAIAG